MVNIIFPGSFDPLTYGHLEIINNSITIFKKLTIAIGDNQEKQSLFSKKERKLIIEEHISTLLNVNVICFEGLLVDLVKTMGQAVIIRGVRDSSDITFEMRMAQINQILYAGISTIFMPVSPKYSVVSSTIVKEIAKLGGPLENFVSPKIREILYEKYKG